MVIGQDIVLFIVHCKNQFVVYESLIYIYILYREKRAKKKNTNGASGSSYSVGANFFFFFFRELVGATFMCVCSLCIASATK